MITSEINTAKESARTLLYQFLSLAFYEPNVDLFEDFKKTENVEQLLAASCLILGSQGEQIMGEILDLINTADADREDALRGLRAEYTRLFMGPMTPACPPYESVFDKERPEESWGIMAGPATDAMAKALADEGLKITLEFAELPDHVAIELEYMYYLLSRAYFGKENVEKYLEKANAFLTEHLVKWLPEFGVLVSQKSNHLFYQKLGVLLEQMIRADTESH